MDPHIGTAGWSIAGKHAHRFPGDGAMLERYARRFNAVEINSTFYRPHRPDTWARWAQSVPASFRFALKVPKAITHERRLADCGELAAAFVEQVKPLGEKLAVLLVQLPPKLSFDAALAKDFLAPLAEAAPARIACEPRHPSWFEDDADSLLSGLGIARVAADPAVVPAAAEPGGWRGLAYWRLHGSPVMYRSSYADRIPVFSAAICANEASERWCIFDNTASSAASSDALALAEAIRRGPPASPTG